MYVPQFERPPTRVPYKAIALAATLFILGSILIVVGALLLAGYIDSKVSHITFCWITNRGLYTCTFYSEKSEHGTNRFFMSSALLICNVGFHIPQRPEVSHQEVFIISEG